jgi:hypothetical protein
MLTCTLSENKRVGQDFEVEIERRHEQLCTEQIRKGGLSQHAGERRLTCSILLQPLANSGLFVVFGFAESEIGQLAERGHAATRLG